MPFTGPRLPRDHHERLGMLDEQLDAWRTYISEPRLAERGSSLAADDRVFPIHTCSQLAWHGIASAVDHLDMFLAVLRAGTSHPLAPITIARTGMLSGAHALWLLDEPDRAERQRRGLRLAHHELTRDSQASHDIALITTPDPDAWSARARDYLDQRTEWMDRVRAAGEPLGLRKPGDFRFDETTLLDTVVARLVERDPDSAALIPVVRVLWRTYSGVAHGLRWPVVHRAQLGGPIPGAISGTVEGRVASTIEELSTAASSISIFLLNAITLYDKRRRAPGSD